MLYFISGGQALIIAAVALVLFGPKKLPEFGRAAGKTLREFKNATQGIMDDDDEKKEKDAKPVNETTARAQADQKEAIVSSNSEQK
ncbi:twin-arginine translocase TatA/TatE family subunit [Fictibacillus sp. Mic-4]|uniref:twin-arginine translocase TatA/TatE family subunit n=1 Tax=Fictibacillus TaxID=1329200 RepID=UPI0004257ABE|nr:twin-arginine translocase TatA/TatE family subunit [Fictibacillus gelatini]